MRLVQAKWTCLSPQTSRKDTLQARNARYISTQVASDTLSLPQEWYVDHLVLYFSKITHPSVQFVDETAAISQVYEPGVEQLRQVPKPCSIIPVSQSYSAGKDEGSQLALGQSFQRRWPLTDATEILLLEHFAHKLSKFVSGTWTPQVVVISVLFTCTSVRLLR